MGIYRIVPLICLHFIHLLLLLFFHLFTNYLFNVVTTLCFTDRVWNYSVPNFVIVILCFVYIDTGCVAVIAVHEQANVGNQ